MTPSRQLTLAEPSCAQVSYYNGSLPVTHAGKLHMPVVKHYVAPMKDDTGMYLDGTEKYTQRVQTGPYPRWRQRRISPLGSSDGLRARLHTRERRPGRSAAPEGATLVATEKSSATLI